MDQEVTLSEMLDIREARAIRQRELLSQWDKTLISFVMNIAGSVKRTPVIERAFREGLFRLEQELLGCGINILHMEESDSKVVCEAMLVVDCEGLPAKKLCMSLEDEDELGRLFDMDVLERKRSWSREQLGLNPRRCMVCGAVGKGCASRRTHSAEQLRQAICGILTNYFRQKDQDTISATALRALLYELGTTPKPGLVDWDNSGSHGDMDRFTFFDSSTALISYFHQAVAIGQTTAHLSPEETFKKLRTAGLRAEAEMCRATGGVNTHKGVIYSLGTVCGACGRLWRPGQPFAMTEEILAECGRIVRKQVEMDFSAVSLQKEETAGQRCYREYSLRGIRGELADGFPSVLSVGLPALNWAMDSGLTVQDAGVPALLALIAQGGDTNLYSRGGLSGARWASDYARDLLKDRKMPSVTMIQRFDQEMTEKNLSPGGCADLLAITYFLHFIQQISKQY